MSSCGQFNCRHAQSSIEKRGDYDSKENATLTIEQLRKHIWQWIDLYHSTPHSELGVPPDVKWHECVDRTNERPIHDIRELDILLRNGSKATVGRNGVKFHGLVYDSDKLSHFKHKRHKAEIKFDASDISRIWVRPSNYSEFIEVPAVWKSYTEGIGLYEHKQIQRDIYENRKKYMGEPEFLEKKARYLETIEELRESGKASKYELTTLKAQEEAITCIDDRDYEDEPEMEIPAQDPLEADLAPSEENSVPSSSSEESSGEADLPAYSVRDTEPRKFPNRTQKGARKAKPKPKKPSRKKTPPPHEAASDTTPAVNTFSNPSLMNPFVNSSPSI